MKLTLDRRRLAHRNYPYLGLVPPVARNTFFFGALDALEDHAWQIIDDDITPVDNWPPRTR